MFHVIEFIHDVPADLDVPGEGRLPQVLIQQGTRLRAQITPYVHESARGPIEVADLFLEDDTTARGVRFAAFRFADQ